MVIGAERYTDANHFSVTKTGTVENDGSADLFFDVPHDAFAWNAELRSPSGGELAVTVATPFGPAIRLGFPIDVTGFDAEPINGCWTPSTSPNCASTPSNVWEYALTTAFQAATSTSYSLKTTVRGLVSVTPSPVVIDPAAAGTTYDRTLNFSAGSIGVEGGAHDPTSARWSPSGPR